MHSLFSLNLLRTAHKKTHERAIPSVFRNEKHKLLLRYSYNAEATILRSARLADVLSAGKRTTRVQLRRRQPTVSQLLEGASAVTSLEAWGFRRRSPGDAGQRAARLPQADREKPGVPQWYCGQVWYFGTCRLSFAFAMISGNAEAHAYVRCRLLQLGDAASAETEVMNQLRLRHPHVVSLNEVRTALFLTCLPQFPVCPCALSRLCRSSSTPYAADRSCRSS